MRGRVAIAALLVGSWSCQTYYVLPDAERTGPDAGSDASRAASPCAAQPPNTVLCEDFDRGELGASWTDSTMLFGSLDTAESRSPPRSLRVTTRPPPPREFSEYLARALGVDAAANVRIELDLRVDRDSGGVFPVGLFCGTAGYAIGLMLGGALVEQGGGVTYTRHPVDLPFPPGQWRHLALRVRRGDGTVELDVDGAPVLGATRLAGAGLVAAGDCRLAIGVYFAPPGTDWDARLDDVVVTTF